ncbi:MAG: hypothetical protein M3Z21_16435 [Pseudomonadota bacterium]|nr:hypothetical protein [Pseudomonadota bacterium]
MALSALERQRRHRQRLVQKGLVFVGGWVPQRDAPALKQQLDGTLPRMRLVPWPGANKPDETRLVVGGTVIALAYRNGGRWIGESPIDPQRWVKRDTMEAALAAVLG